VLGRRCRRRCRILLATHHRYHRAAAAAAASNHVSLHDMTVFIVPIHSSFIDVHLRDHCSLRIYFRESEPSLALH